MGAVQSMSPARQGAEAFFQGSATLLNSTDGLTRISEFSLGVFSMIAHFFKSLPESFVIFGGYLEKFVDLTCIVSIAKRCRNWFVADKDGKMLWHKAWDQITTIACLTAAQVIGFVKFLSTTLKIFELGRALLPLSIASNVLFAAFSAFDMVGNVKGLKSAESGKEKAERDQRTWASRVNMTDKQWVAKVAQQQKLWANRVITHTNANDSAKLAVAKAKVEQWAEARKTISNGLLGTVNKPLMQTFCNRKVEQLKVVASNQNTEKTKSILGIVYNVALIALMILSTIMAFLVPPAGLVIATIATAIVTSGFDVVNFFAENFMKGQEVKAVTV